MTWLKLHEDINEEQNQYIEFAPIANILRLFAAFVLMSPEIVNDQARWSYWLMVYQPRNKWPSQSNQFSCENYTFLQVTHSILLKHMFHTSSSEMSPLSYAWTRRCTAAIVSVRQALTTLICSSPMAVHRTIQSFSGFWKSVKALRVSLLFTAKVYAHFNRWWFVLIKLIIRVKVCLVFMITWCLIAVK